MPHVLAMTARELGDPIAGVVDDATFVAAGIDPTERPERLGVEAWGRLAVALGR